MYDVHTIWYYIPHLPQFNGENDNRPLNLRYPMLEQIERCTLKGQTWLKQRGRCQVCKLAGHRARAYVRSPIAEDLDVLPLRDQRWQCPPYFCCCSIPIFIRYLDILCIWMILDNIYIQLYAHIFGFIYIYICIYKYTYICDLMWFVHLWYMCFWDA